MKKLLVILVSTIALNAGSYNLNQNKLQSLKIQLQNNVKRERAKKILEYDTILRCIELSSTYAEAKKCTKTGRFIYRHR